MRAIVQDQYGTAEVLELRTVDRPRIASTQVADRGPRSRRGPRCRPPRHRHPLSDSFYLIRSAGYGITKPKHPIPGADVAGRVASVGDDVTRFRPGDEVFGTAMDIRRVLVAMDEAGPRSPEVVEHMTAATGRRVFGGLCNCDGSASPGETARTSGVIVYEVQDDGNRKVASDGYVDIGAYIPES